MSRSESAILRQVFATAVLTLQMTTLPPMFITEPQSVQYTTGVEDFPLLPLLPEALELPLDFTFDFWLAMDDLESQPLVRLGVGERWFHFILWLEDCGALSHVCCCHQSTSLSGYQESQESA